jgi:hypothetical protein
MGQLDLRPTMDKAAAIFGHDIPGIFLRYVKVRIQNLISTGKRLWRFPGHMGSRLKNLRIGHRRVKESKDRK